MGFLEALLLLFIALKLTGVIAWPWFAVLAPLYPDIILYILIAVFGFGFWRKHKREGRKFDEDFEKMNWPRF